MVRMTNNLDCEIGKRLRRARLAKNLTQSGLAKKIGISFQQIQKYENGSNRVSSSRLWDISNKLEIPVTYFFENLEDVKGIPPTEVDKDNDLTDRTIRAARLLNEIPDGNIKDKLFLLIKAFHKEKDE